MALTFERLKEICERKINSEGAKKVAVIHLRDMVRNCDNRITSNVLDKLCDRGFTDVIVAVDSSGEVVGDITLVEDKNTTRDSNVQRLLGSEGMVIIEA